MIQHFLQEMVKVPGFLFKRGRKLVLKSFLSQERIFSTNEFYERFEGIARRNLNAALTNL